PCPQCEQTTALCKAITPFQKETPIPFGVTVTIPLNLEQRSSNKRNKWGPAVGGEQAVYAGLMLERRVRFSSYRCSTAIKLSEEPYLKEIIPFVLGQTGDLLTDFDS